MALIRRVSLKCSYGGILAQKLAYLLLDPAAPGSIPCGPKIFSEEKIVNITEVNQRHCLEESGQWLENVDQTHLVLASGKPVLQKYIKGLIKSLENFKSLLNSHKKETKTF